MIVNQTRSNIEIVCCINFFALEYLLMLVEKLWNYCMYNENKTIMELKHIENKTIVLMILMFKILYQTQY